MADRLLPAAAEQMACDAAGRKYSRPPPRRPLSRSRGQRCKLAGSGFADKFGPQLPNEFGPHLWILDELDHE